MVCFLCLSLLSFSPLFHSSLPSLPPFLSPSLPLFSSFIFTGLKTSEYSKQDFYFLQLHYQPLKTAAQSADARSRSLIMYLLRVPSSTQRLLRIDAKLSSAKGTGKPKDYGNKRMSPKVFRILTHQPAKKQFRGLLYFLICICKASLRP